MGVFKTRDGEMTEWHLTMWDTVKPIQLLRANHLQVSDIFDNLSAVKADLSAIYANRSAVYTSRSDILSFRVLNTPSLSFFIPLY